jgi:hypothetical protein
MEEVHGALPDVDIPRTSAIAAAVSGVNDRLQGSRYTIERDSIKGLRLVDEDTLAKETRERVATSLAVTSSGPDIAAMSDKLLTDAGADFDRKSKKKLPRRTFRRDANVSERPEVKDNHLRATETRSQAHARRKAEKRKKEKTSV